MESLTRDWVSTAVRPDRMRAAPSRIGIASMVGMAIIMDHSGMTYLPAKVIVGSSTAGLAGREGEVMKKTLPYGVVIAGVVGLLAWLVIYAA